MGITRKGERRTRAATVDLGILKRSTGFDVFIVAQLVLGVFDEVPDVVEGRMTVGSFFPKGVLLDGTASALATPTMCS